MNIDRNSPQPESVRPNFFLAGVPKAGTSTLYLWLRQHPQIALSSPKELHFFCSCPPHLRRDGSLEGYLSHFKQGKAIGEASPCYSYYPEVPATLATMFPDSHVLICLRDPVDRFWSHFLMNEAYHQRDESPNEIVARNLREGSTNAVNDLVGLGRYAEQLQRLLKYFRPEQILVTFLEEMAVDPARVLDRVLQFLTVDSLPLNTSAKDKQYVGPKGWVGRIALRNPVVRRAGVAIIPAGIRRTLRTRLLGDPGKRPDPPEDIVERLRSVYRADAKRLEVVLGQELPWSWHH